MSLDVKIPSLGESVTEATIGAWVKENGDAVEMDEVICEVESDKASVELRAEEAGTLEILVEEGETVAVGDTIARIDTDAKPEEKPAEATEESAEQAEKPTEPEEKPDEPESREKEQKSVQAPKPEPEQAHPMGKPAAAKEPRPEVQPEPKPTHFEKPETPRYQASAAGDRPVRRQRMSTLRKTISSRMLQAKQGTAMLTTINEADMSELKRIRAEYNEKIIEKHGIKIGFVSFIARVCSIALQEFPIINAMLDGDEIVYNNFSDIAIAVSTDRGLVVPVIRNVGTMNVVEIEKAIVSLAERARDSKLSIDEMTGGTFTITNGGVFGSLISTPIINTPQSAILGLHAIQDRPVVRDGEIVIRPMMYLALSYDHRLIDGRDSVRFLVRVKEMIEDPSRLLFEV